MDMHLCLSVSEQLDLFVSFYSNLSLIWPDLLASGSSGVGRRRHLPADESAAALALPLASIYGLMRARNRCNQSVTAQTHTDTALLRHFSFEPYISKMCSLRVLMIRAGCYQNADFAKPG